MRSLLFHVKKYQVEVTGLATRPDGIEPEPLTDKERQSVDNAILCFVTVESTDGDDEIAQLSKEIKKFCQETGENKIIITPFAHLSNDLAGFSLARSLLGALAKQFDEYELHQTHFGSDKELLLHIFGHPGNARYREF